MAASTQSSRKAQAVSKLHRQRPHTKAMTANAPGRRNLQAAQPQETEAAEPQYMEIVPYARPGEWVLTVYNVPWLGTVDVLVTDTWYLEDVKKLIQDQIFETGWVNIP